MFACDPKTKEGTRSEVDEAMKVSFIDPTRPRKCETPCQQRRACPTWCVLPSFARGSFRLRPNAKEIIRIRRTWSWFGIRRARDEGDSNAHSSLGGVPSSPSVSSVISVESHTCSLRQRQHMRCCKRLTMHSSAPLRVPPILT